MGKLMPEIDDSLPMYAQIKYKIKIEYSRSYCPWVKKGHIYHPGFNTEKNVHIGSAEAAQNIYEHESTKSS